MESLRFVLFFTLGWLDPLLCLDSRGCLVVLLLSASLLPLRCVDVS